jgi:Ca2+-transporting ATPase
MLFSMLLGLPMALVPIQILMVNLLTDGLPAIALGMDPPDEQILQRPPRPKDEGVFAQGLLQIILLRGIFLGLATAGAYYAVWCMGHDLAIAQSAAFITLVLAQMVHIFECRGKNFSLRGNPVLLLAAGISVLVTLLSVYLPIAQRLFGTVAVTGTYLFPVFIGIVIGPLGTALLRKCKHFFV